MSEVLDVAPVTAEEIKAGLLAGFPFPEIRPTQDSALGSLARSRVEKKKFTIWELPTGVGKSGCAVAAAQYATTLPSSPPFARGAYYLTSQKSLQSQLMNDFSKLGLVELKGKNNYKCINTLAAGVDCETASNGFGETCADCPYRTAKTIFGNSPMGVTNYSYYMHETVYSGELPQKEFLIADEGHNLEKEILSLVEIRFTPGRSTDLDIAPPPTFSAGDEEEVIDWLVKYPLPKIRTLTRELRMEIELHESDPARGKAAEKRKRLAALYSFMGKLEVFTETKDPNEWVAWTDEDRNLLIKPLTGAMFADDYVFQNAASVVIMSATILDFKTFRRNLGIPFEDSVCLRAASEFPIENRKIVFWPVGSMAFKDIQETLPKMCARIEKLLKDRWPMEKGIIHTHTYKIAQQIINHLNAAGLGHRIITHNSNPGDRDSAILRHLVSTEPSVLISPSMTEGLDLKGDHSRFQIICKVPYPYMDPYTKVRMERDPDWYQLQTALVLMQASGRSIRSADDYATTVILDSGFAQFMTRNEGILPKWWRAAVVTK